MVSEGEAHMESNGTPSGQARWRLLAVLGVALALLMAACSGSGQRRYSDEVRANFLTACGARGASSEYCRCFLEYMEARETEREFLRMEAELELEGTAADVLYKAVEACR